MGFTGISSWIDSDEAADLKHDVDHVIAGVLKKGLKNPGNEYNTPGYINVLLIGLNLNLEFATDNLLRVLDLAEQTLKEEIPSWGPNWKRDLNNLLSRWQKHKKSFL